jgi:hypothetical protein
MTKLLSQAALLLNKTYRLLSTGSLSPEYRPLLDLPPELIAMIFEDNVLANDDLETLRLTCKHTKYFASDILARRHFIDMDVHYNHYGSGWFAHLLSSDLGSHARSLSLTRPEWWRRPRHHALPKGNTKPDYSRLQYLRVTYCGGAIDSWKRYCAQRFTSRSSKSSLLLLLALDIKFHTAFESIVTCLTTMTSFWAVSDPTL